MGVGGVTPQRLLTGMLWAVILGLIVPLYLRLALDDPLDYARGGLGAGDFKEYYIAARLIARGENIYDATLQAREMDALGLPRDDLGYRQTAYLYPSLLAAMLMPLGGLPITEAGRFWNLMNVALLAIALFLLTEALDLRGSLGNHYPWLIILFAVATSTTISLRLGQVNILILFLLGLYLYAQRHRCSVLAGFALGLATLFKVFPGGLLALLLTNGASTVLSVKMVLPCHKGVGFQAGFACKLAPLVTIQERLSYG